MNRVRAGQALIILGHAAVPWALCGAVIGIGKSVTSEENTLLVHLVAVPVFFSLASLSYFSRFRYTSPLTTATTFLAFAILMDALVVAPLVEHSYKMFSSVLGVWIPFALIFASTFITGSVLRGGRALSPTDRLEQEPNR